MLTPLVLVVGILSPIIVPLLSTAYVAAIGCGIDVAIWTDNAGDSGNKGGGGGS